MSWKQLLTVSLFSSQFQNIPVQLKTLVTDIYVVAGQENIKAVWKEPNLHVRPYKELAVITMAKMPKETLEFWKWDDSGHHAQPHPDSNVPPHLRIDYLTHSSVARLLTGPGLKPLADRFTKNLMIRLSKSEYLNQEWSDLPDLFAFMQQQLFPAAVEAMCGELLFSVNPKFVGDFWAFNKGLPYLAKGYPRWMVPSAYRARDTVLNGLKKWHLAIASELKCPPIAMDEWSPDFGVELVRFRHDAWSKMPLMNEDAAATEDLGMIWAANGNSIPTSFWMIAEVVRDADLLRQVRAAVAKYVRVSEHEGLDFDYERLCNDPLLQSVYAETLRLHVASFLFRGSDRKDFDLNGWRIPRDAPILVSGHDAQMDPDVWTPKDKPHRRPVHQFWPERFLVRPTAQSKGMAPDFSFKGLGNSWLPYGGGNRMCPGRHFAKQEMVSSLAMMLTLFDIEMVNPKGKIPENDLVGYGFGALWPKQPMPVRLRRRKA
ncbi:MAG: hypothetical protein LQ349_006761 [Xanthoria aureola]|nr:MAG: hypothetical protein LQ349_006761 [Xanthoria aureola]